MSWLVVDQGDRQPHVSQVWGLAAFPSVTSALSKSRAHADAAQGLSSPVQFSRSVVSDSLWPHGLQHTRLSCPSSTPGLLKLMSIESMMPPNHLTLYHPLLLLPSIFPSIKVFSKESVLHIRWPKYWSFSLVVQTWAKGSSLPGWMGRFQGQSQVFSSTGEAITTIGIAGERGDAVLWGVTVWLSKSMTPTAHFLPPEMRTWGAGRLADLGLEKEEQKIFNSQSWDCATKGRRLPSKPGGCWVTSIRIFRTALPSKNKPSARWHWKCIFQVSKSCTPWNYGVTNLWWFLCFLLRLSCHLSFLSLPGGAWSPDPACLSPLLH